MRKIARIIWVYLSKPIRLYFKNCDEALEKIMEVEEPLRSIMLEDIFSSE